LIVRVVLIDLKRRVELSGRIKFSGVEGES
jgi:hypothetical protein